jgi:hypothetical protein
MQLASEAVSEAVVAYGGFAGVCARAGGTLRIATTGFDEAGRLWASGAALGGHVQFSGLRSSMARGKRAEEIVVETSLPELECLDYR